jgi:S-adenosylmethionine decarboxylase
MTATDDKGPISASSATLKDLAPGVFRQRLLVEGFFGGEMSAERVRACLLGLAEALDLSTYGEPVVFEPASGMGKDDNAGFDAFVPLIDSGISAYFWTGPGFFSLLLYTCKGFDQEAAVAWTRELLEARGELVAHAF